MTPPPASLPGLDPLARHMLARAGIHSLQELRALGSVEAYVRAQAANVHVGLPLLWSLEAVLTGQPWRQVEREHRARLLRALACTPRQACARTSKTIAARA
ncbi:TfoX/Sxy family DNA transformation protein [Acidovorax sp. MR-S7]|uniref:TfoX/Sxy family DNA transformation protein n=1 Tax=Acidovorax sp. MR-S7 TaxID=1268622 RepID=UPI0003D3B486|nr:TfoX/Sxy family DNA transformation protein [Acidovorax sp. MR-S7]GAD23330.1 regulator of competence-specific genes [Acidovorax sp. MR-S7]